MFCFLLLVCFLILHGSSAHGNIMSVKAISGTAGPMGKNALRLGVPRADTSIPGPIENYRCDWCVLENFIKLPRFDEKKWYSTNPAANIGKTEINPSLPCMSFDKYGDRGILDVKPGETLETKIYINSDHGGFYRYEYAEGTPPFTNEDFSKNPLTPWLSLHESSETRGTYPDRVVGYTHNDTMKYFLDMDRQPGLHLGDLRLNHELANPDDPSCKSENSTCFLYDDLSVPSNATEGAKGVIRWIWFSMETSQGYSNCLDVCINCPYADLTPSGLTSSELTSSGSRWLASSCLHCIFSLVVLVLLFGVSFS